MGGPADFLELASGVRVATPFFGFGFQLLYWCAPMHSRNGYVDFSSMVSVCQDTWHLAADPDQE